MALEIERKYLPVSDGWRTLVERSVSMKQAYLGGQGVSIRIRMTDDSALINIKQLRLGISREEFEYAIPYDDGVRLMELAGGGSVEKVRHYVQYGGLLWEIDEFSANNQGLIVAEVELETEGQSIDIPPWLGEEVTDVERYYNVSLATHPYNQWSETE